MNLMEKVDAGQAVLPNVDFAKGSGSDWPDQEGDPNIGNGSLVLIGENRKSTHRRLPSTLFKGYTGRIGRVIYHGEDSPGIPYLHVSVQGKEDFTCHTRDCVLIDDEKAVILRYFYEIHRLAPRARVHLLSHVCLEQDKRVHLTPDTMLWLYRIGLLSRDLAKEDMHRFNADKLLYMLEGKSWQQHWEGGFKKTPPVFDFQDASPYGRESRMNPCGEVPIDAATESCLPVPEPEEEVEEEKDPYSLKVSGLAHRLDQILYLCDVIGPRPRDVYLTTIRLMRVRLRYQDRWVKAKLEKAERSLQELPSTLSRAEEIDQARELCVNARNTVHNYKLYENLVDDERTYDLLKSELQRLGAEFSAEEHAEDLSGENAIRAWQDWHDKPRMV